MIQASIYLKPSDAEPVRALAFPEYHGNKFAFQSREQYSCYASSLCWSGGSKTEVAMLRQRNGQIERAELTTIAPWSGDEWRINPIPPDVLIVEHVYFCGKDQGLRFYAAPNSVWIPRMLTAPEAAPDMSDAEKTVLVAHIALTSAARADYKAKYPAAIDALVERKLLRRSSNGATAVTLDGKNMASALRASDPKLRNRF